MTTAPAAKTSAANTSAANTFAANTSAAKTSASNTSATGGGRYFLRGEPNPQIVSRTLVRL